MKLRLREVKPFSQSNTVSDGGKTWDAWFFHLQSLEFWMSMLHGGAEAHLSHTQGSTGGHGAPRRGTGHRGRWPVGWGPIAWGPSPGLEQRFTPASFLHDLWSTTSLLHCSGPDALPSPPATGGVGSSHWDVALHSEAGVSMGS